MTLGELETNFKCDFKRELRLRADESLDAKANMDDNVIVTMAKPFSVFLVSPYSLDSQAFPRYLVNTQWSRYSLPWTPLTLSGRSLEGALFYSFY